MNKSGKVKQIHQTRKIQKITTHPDFKRGKLENNLALVKLDRPVRICPGHVETVKLPSCNSMKPGRQSSSRAASPLKSQNAWPPQVKVSIKSKKGRRFIEVKQQVHSWKKCFCLREPVFRGSTFRILRLNFPNFEA